MSHILCRMWNKCELVCVCSRVCLERMPQALIWTIMWLCMYYMLGGSGTRLRCHFQPHSMDPRVLNNNEFCYKILYKMINIGIRKYINNIYCNLSVWYYATNVLQNRFICRKTTIRNPESSTNLGCKLVLPEQVSLLNGNNCRMDDM